MFYKKKKKQVNKYFFNTNTGLILIQINKKYTLTCISIKKYTLTCISIKKIYIDLY